MTWTLNSIYKTSMLATQRLGLVVVVVVVLVVVVDVTIKMSMQHGNIQKTKTFCLVGPRPFKRLQPSSSNMTHTHRMIHAPEQTCSEQCEMKASL